LSCSLFFAKGESPETQVSFIGADYRESRIAVNKTKDFQDNEGVSKTELLPRGDGLKMFGPNKHSTDNRDGISRDRGNGSGPGVKRVYRSSS
jgi:hypothetical protein